jgi:rhodanese-related sulfurtransferase
MKMEPVHCYSGEAIIKQGDEGDRFFIIREGTCKVTRKTRKNPEGMVLAKLGVGDNFGEEALISGGKRNATVEMITDGMLMSLSKDDFLELMNEPLLHWVSFNDAKARARDGAVWLDVRLPAEYQSRHIIGSVNLPLPLLRVKLDKLDRNKTYIACCDTGRRSSTAAYLLTQNNINAYVLENGLQVVPAEEFEG